jgi:hypothetical protein
LDTSEQKPRQSSPGFTKGETYTDWCLEWQPQILPKGQNLRKVANFINLTKWKNQPPFWRVILGKVAKERSNDSGQQQAGDGEKGVTGQDRSA